jgi:hypothetical protein
VPAARLPEIESTGTCFQHPVAESHGPSRLFVSLVAVALPERTDWLAWHTPYADPASPLSQRLGTIKEQIRAFIDERAGDELRAISVCAGDGRDLLETLVELSDRPRVRARLVELDPELARRARAAAAAHGLTGVEVVRADASESDVYADAVPVDLVLLCGVLGNIADADVHRMIRALPQFCVPGARVVWTRHRRAPDLTPQIRDWLAGEGFSEHAFISPGPDAWSVGAHSFHGNEQPLERGERLFTFVR